MSKSVAVLSLVILVSLSLLPLVSTAAFTENGITIYCPPYQYYVYKSGQSVVLNFTAKGYPNTPVTVEVYNPKDEPLYYNVFETNSQGNLAVTLFTVPNATPQYIKEGYINGTYTINVIVGSSLGFTVYVQLELLYPKPSFSLTLTVSSSIPYYINGTEYTYNTTQTFTSPINVSFPKSYVVQKGLIMVNVTGVYVNTTLQSGNYVFLNSPGTYSVSPATVTLYNVSFPYLITINVNGRNMTGSWFWLPVGSTVEIYQQVVAVSPGVFYFVKSQSFTVNRPGQVQLKGYTAYEVTFRFPVNVTVNGETTVTSKLYVQPGTTITVNPYIYKAQERIPVNVSQREIVVSAPMSVNVTYGTPQYLVYVYYNGAEHPMWITQDSQLPSYITIGPYSRLALTQPVTVTGPMDATGYYELEYAVDINGNITWVPKGAQVFLPAGSNPLAEFFFPTYYEGNYTGVGGVYLTVESPIFETSYTGLNIWHILLLVLVVIIIVLLVLLARKRKTYATAQQVPQATRQPEVTQLVQPVPQHTQPAQQPTDQQTKPVIVLQVSQLSPGQITPDGKATLDLSVNKEAVLTFARLKVNGSIASNTPVYLKPGNNRVELLFQPLGQMAVDKVEVSMKLVDTETKDVVEFNAFLIPLQPTVQVTSVTAQQPTVKVQPVKLAVTQVGEGTITQQGIATVTLQANKAAVITSAVLLANGSQAINLPIRLNPGNNTVTLMFGPIVGFMMYMRYQISVKILDPETNEVQELTLTVISY